MSFRKRGGQSINTPIDASYGLIYRLNYLWMQADFAALAGDFDKWNFILDRIYSNLLYRDNMLITYKKMPNKHDVPTDISKIDLSREDGMVFKRFRRLIKNIKEKKMQAIRSKKRTEFNNLSEEHYHMMMLKDIWLRKFMQDRGLYLREIEFDPSKAMWGG